MPTVRTIVADLWNNNVNGGPSVHGFGTLFSTGLWDEDAAIDANRHIYQRTIGVRVTFDGVNFQVAKTGVGQNRSGWVLGYSDGTTTIATISRANGRICVSPDYSGCLFSVYEHNGNYKCCHTSRPENNEQYVAELQQYAAQQNWNLVHVVPTRVDHLNGLENGAGKGGCNTTVVVTRMSYSINPPVVRSVRLRMNYQFRPIHRARFTTPVAMPRVTAQD